MWKLIAIYVPLETALFYFILFLREGKEKNSEGEEDRGKEEGERTTK